MKVGDGETLPPSAIESPEEVAAVLGCLLEERRTWLYSHRPPDRRLSMLANYRSVALLTPDANLIWMCHPGARGPIFAACSATPPPATSPSTATRACRWASVTSPGR